jgi:hypothetical protein
MTAKVVYVFRFGIVAHLFELYPALFGIFDGSSCNSLQEDAKRTKTFAAGRKGTSYPLNHTVIFVKLA